MGSVGTSSTFLLAPSLFLHFLFVATEIVPWVKVSILDTGTVTERFLSIGDYMEQGRLGGSVG